MYSLTTLCSIKRTSSFADLDGMPWYGVLRPALKKPRTTAYRPSNDFHRFAWVVPQDPFRFLDLPPGMTSNPYCNLNGH